MIETEIRYRKNVKYFLSKGSNFLIFSLSIRRTGNKIKSIKKCPKLLINIGKAYIKAIGSIATSEAIIIE